MMTSPPPLGNKKAVTVIMFNSAPTFLLKDDLRQDKHHSYNNCLRNKE